MKEEYTQKELELKRRLNGYYHTKQLIRVLEDCKKEHEEFIKVCKERNISYEEKESIDYAAMLEKAYAEALVQKNKVQEDIELMNDYPEYKSVLYARYICNNNTLEIAEQMYCGRNTVLRYHKHAIKILCEKLEGLT